MAYKNKEKLSMKENVLRKEKIYEDSDIGTRIILLFDEKLTIEFEESFFETIEVDGINYPIDDLIQETELLLHILKENRKEVLDHFDKVKEEDW